MTWLYLLANPHAGLIALPTWSLRRHVISAERPISRATPAASMDSMMLLAWIVIGVVLMAASLAIRQAGSAFNIDSLTENFILLAVLSFLAPAHCFAWLVGRRIFGPREVEQLADLKQLCRNTWVLAVFGWITLLAAVAFAMLTE